MALIKTETFTNENGVEMIRDTYDTMIVERPAHIPESDETEPQPTQLDRIEEAVNAIANSENSEAINVLLGG